MVAIVMLILGLSLSCAREPPRAQSRERQKILETATAREVTCAKAHTCLARIEKHGTNERRPGDEIGLAGVPGPHMPSL